jgi:ArsR family transcriptional regulator
MTCDTSSASALLKILGNKDRLRVLCHLVDGEKTVGAMEEALAIRQTTLSQHLARLRHEGLVDARRDGQHVYYRLVSSASHKMLNLLHALYCEPPAATA